MNHIAPGRMIFLHPPSRTANWYLQAGQHFEDQYEQSTHMNMVPATQ